MSNPFEEFLKSPQNQFTSLIPMRRLMMRTYLEYGLFVGDYVYYKGNKNQLYRVYSFKPLAKYVDAVEIIAYTPGTMHFTTKIVHPSEVELFKRSPLLHFLFGAPDPYDYDLVKRGIIKSNRSTNPRYYHKATKETSWSKLDAFPSSAGNQYDQLRVSDGKGGQHTVTITEVIPEDARPCHAPSCGNVLSYEKYDTCPVCFWYRCTCGSCGCDHPKRENYLYN